MTDARQSPPPLRSGLVQGGQGGPGNELLEDGQEEVFARTEVETGHIEHQAEAGGEATPDEPVEDAPPPTYR